VANYGISDRLFATRCFKKPHSHGAPGREYRRLIPERKKASSELRDIYSF
jgi:hypothetical protein